MRVLVAIILAIASVIPSANAFSLMTWNVAEGSVENVARRMPQMVELGQAVTALQNGALPDVVVLQEVTSFAAAERVARGLGYKEATVAVTDAGNDREIWPFALEVAIVTTRAVISVTSHQSKPLTGTFRSPFIVNLGSGAVTFGSTEEIVVPSVIPGGATEFVPRGILRVELEGGIVIYGIHFNSSGLGFCRLDDAMKGGNELKKKAEALGLDADAAAITKAMTAVRSGIRRAQEPGIEATKQEALRRARSREAAAGAVMTLASADIRAGKSVFVAGDFNTPLQEACKTGTDLKDDFEPMIGCRTRLTSASCAGKDGFDDTYAVMTSGIVGGIKLRVLTDGIGRTYANTTFVDSPIDNVLVGGSLDAATFSARKLSGTTAKPFGSDHFPVLVVRN